MRVSVPVRRLTIIAAVVVLASTGPRPAAAQSPAPTPRPGLAPAAAKAALKCGKALGKSANGFVTRKSALLKKCTDAVAGCLQGAPDAVPACLGRARATCDAGFAAIAAEEAKLVRALATACATTTSADLLADAGLGFGLPALTATCAAVGVTPLASVADAAACIARFHGCQVEQLLGVQAPLAGYLLGLVGRPAVRDDCTAVAPSPEPTTRPGTVPAVVAKNVVKCAKALTKAANGFVARKAGLLKKCTDAVAACVQGKPTALATCVAKARAKCDQQFDGIGKAEAKLVRAVGDTCGSVVTTDLLAEAGLGFGLPAFAATCAAVGVPAIADLADVAACLARAHECRVEQLLSVQVPLASYLLGLVGRPLVSAYCTPPTPVPTVTGPTPSAPPPTATPTAGASASTPSPTPSPTASAGTATATVTGVAPTATASGPAPTPTPGGPVAVVLNPSLAPAQDTVLDRGVPQPVAASRDEFGVQTDFLEGHVIVRPRDQAELAAFLDRYGAVVVRDDTVPEPPAESGIQLTAEERAPQAFLVRLDLDRTRVEEVVANAEATGITGVMEFSTENGLRTFAGVVDARAQGFVVSGDFLYQGAQAFPYTLLRTEERPTTVPTALPTPAFVDALSAGAYADYGRTGNQSDVWAAWQFLAAHGITRRVRVAIIDGGFWLDPQGRAWGPDSDFPAPPARADQYDVDFEDFDADGSSAISCGQGSPCYWHGTGSAGSAMGIANNRRGGAGSGMQVADPILLRWNGTKAQRNIAVRIAVLWNADVVSMSFGGKCNVWCRIDDRADNPFDEAIADGRRVVFLAAAGNGEPPPGSPPGAASVGIPVGDPNFFHPCTEEFVICVGALTPGGNGPTGYSNFGPQVQIFAPTNIPVMSYPNSFDAFGNPLPPSQAFGPEVPQVFSGTSASTPFVAGVAAMIKALRPELDHGQVAQILRDTAKPGAVVPVTRTLDAYAAVVRAAEGLSMVADLSEPDGPEAAVDLGAVPPYQRLNRNLDVQDRDFFRFDAPNGALMTLTLSYPQPLGAVSVAKLETLAGSCGSPAFVSETARAGGGKVLAYRVPGGPHRLTLLADAINAYDLGITFAGNAYAPDQYELNETPANARYLYSLKSAGGLAFVGKDPRVTIDATIGGAADVDWYLVRGVRPTGAESVLLAAFPSLELYGNDSTITLDVFRRNPDGSVGAPVASLNGGACTSAPLAVRLDADEYYLVRVTGAPGRYALRNGVGGDARRIPILVRDRVFEILNPLDPITRPLRNVEAFVLVADAGYARVRTPTPGVHLRLFDADGAAVAEGEALDPGPGEALDLGGTVPGAAYALLVEPEDEAERDLELVVDPVEPVRTSANLVVNAGAEIIDGDFSDDFVGWDLVDGLPQPRLFFYDDQEGNPSLSDPGPEERGFHLFAGGDGNALSGLRQFIFVDPSWRTAVDAGRARFRFGAYLGGYRAEGDFAEATVTFFSINQQPLASFPLQPVTPLERDDQTGLWLVEVRGTVPPSTVFLNVDLRFTRLEGDFNDGYADEVELVFSELPAP